MHIRLGILTTLWQRAELERVVMEYYRGLQVDGATLVLMAVGSEGEASRSRAEDSGWMYRDWSNDPLGAKHNLGLWALRAYDVDAVMVIGSDDLVSTGAIEHAVRALQVGSVLHVVNGLHVWDTSSDRILWCPGALPGAGAVYSRSLLEVHGWRLWSDINEGLDTDVYKNVWRGAFPKTSLPAEAQTVAPILDIKQGVNMWPASNYEPAATAQYDAKGWLNKHFPGIYNQITKSHVSDTEL